MVDFLRIEEIIEEYHINGIPHQVPNCSNLFVPRENNLCWELKLSKKNKEPYEWLYIYTGTAWQHIDTAWFLAHAFNEADYYHGEDTYESWEANNMLEEMLGQPTSRLLYEYTKEISEKLLAILGEDLYDLLDAEING